MFFIASGWTGFNALDRDAEPGWTWLSIGCLLYGFIGLNRAKRWWDEAVEKVDVSN